MAGSSPVPPDSGIQDTDRSDESDERPPGDVPRQRPGRGPRRPSWRRRLLVVGLVLVLVAGGAGIYVYHQLNRNIRHVPLFAGDTGDAGVEVPDAFGRVPINLLVIGSDTRGTKADCKLGGGCDRGPEIHADVEMVVHVAADRSNITVMSLPRDTMTDLPGCTDPVTGTRIGARYGQINSTLTHGPGCTVAAVHKLTGIPIDHFVMVDFAGVISMSDSVGGVSVCVTDNVYDTYSHLKLTAGTHTLKGLAALEFVRSRHGFGDGGDLGRTYAQHAYLSAVIRSLKRKGVLLNPTAVYALAQAATRALTVDTELASIPKLLGLAADVNKVSPERITFTTMQTTPDPADLNRVLVAPAAKQLFATIIQDRSLTADPGATPTPTPTPSPTATGDPATISVRVVNGSGTGGRATELAAALDDKGFRRTTTASNPETVTGTTLQYGPGERVDAETVAAALGMPTSALDRRTSTGLTLRIGSDWTTGTTYPTRAGSEAATRQAALDEAHAATATSSSCVPVSTQHTVTVNGVSMTPTRAFEESPDVPLSAR